MSVKTTQELIEYFDHINASLNADYEHVSDQTRELLRNDLLDKETKIHLKWSLAKLHADLVNFHITVKNYQDILRNADKKI